MRVLIVEDNAPLRSAIARRIRAWGSQPLEAGNAREAHALLSASPDLIVVDLHLPDGLAFGVIEAASQLWPKPVCVGISGRASPEQAFRLAQLGVRSFIEKPFSLEQLEQAVESAYRDAPRLELLIAACVGRVPLRELQDRLRDVMMHQALALSKGSRSETARLLAVSRQAIQQMLRRRTPGAAALAAPTHADAPETPAE